MAFFLQVSRHQGHGKACKSQKIENPFLDGWESTKPRHWHVKANLSLTETV